MKTKYDIMIDFLTDVYNLIVKDVKYENYFSLNKSDKILLQITILRFIQKTISKIF